MRERIHAQDLRPGDLIILFSRRGRKHNVESKIFDSETIAFALVVEMHRTHNSLYSFTVFVENQFMRKCLCTHTDVTVLRC